MLSPLRALCFASAMSIAYAAANGPVPNRPPLAASHFQMLPLGSVKPAGWLRQQLRTQADGLSGHLEEFWADLGPDSAWLGGKGEGWERGPYYLDGLVPLAYLLDDPVLIARAHKWIEWALTHQRADGWLGPEKNTDWWPNFVMLKVLTQYQEATGDPRVIPAMQRYFAYQAANIDARPLKEWAIYRWQDEALSLIWLYNRTGNPKLIELAKKLHSQGYYWPDQFAHFPDAYKEKVQKPDIGLKTHGVNNSQGLKTGAVWYELTGDHAALEGMYNQLRVLDKYHLQPSEVHSGDEHYAGLSPSQGTELCSVAETMFSIENMLEVTGDAAFGDRLEKVTYNAFPGTFDGPMWAHQYDQQANQVLVSKAKRDWSSNGPDSNLFGLEPNFGCCTTNMHQGWPKFVASLWMATSDGGLAAVAYGPSTVTSMVKGSIPVTITEDTGYPFRDRVQFQVDPKSAVRFPLELRIPAWTSGAIVEVNGRAIGGVTAGAFTRIDREWKAGDKVSVRLPMPIEVKRWYHDAVSVERGPLIYSLAVGEKWEKVKDRPQAPDWSVEATTPWNYGLVLGSGKTFSVSEKPIGSQPFSPGGAPVVIEAKGRKIPEWTIVDNSAAAPPQSPVKSAEKDETIRLIPYGSAKLRITAFPQIAK